MSQLPSSYPPKFSQPPQPVLPPKPVSVLATVSCIAGTSSLLEASLFCCCGILILPLMFVGSLAAVITGHIALAQFKRDPEKESGYELALIGLITGYIALALLVAVTVAVLIGAAFSAPNWGRI